MLSRLPLVAGHDRLAVGLGRVQPGLKCQPMTLVISRRLGLVFGHTAARWQTAAASAERPGGQLASSSAGRRLGHQAQPPRRAEPVLRLRRFHPVGQRCGCEAWGTHRQPPRRSLTSDGCIDHQLPGLQRCQCLLALGTRLIQAMREQKLIGAGRLRRTEPSRHRRALGVNGLALLGGFVGGQGTGAQADQPEDCQQATTDAASSPHVKRVSTSRRSSARYSDERISCKRETVRGNSCVNGPSVYSASAGTAADSTSLTRRS